MSLWVHTTEQPMNPLTEQLVEHDLDDTRHLIEVAKGLPDEEYRKERFPGETVLSWDGEDSSIVNVLEHQVFTKEVWLAAIEGTRLPDREGQRPGPRCSSGTTPPPRAGWRSSATSTARAPGTTG